MRPTPPHPKALLRALTALTCLALIAPTAGCDDDAPSGAATTVGSMDDADAQGDVERSPDTGDDVTSDTGASDTDQQPDDVDQPDAPQPDLPPDDAEDDADDAPDDVAEDVTGDAEQMDAAPDVPDGPAPCVEGVSTAPFTLHADYCPLVRVAIPEPEGFARPSALNFRGSEVWVLFEDVASQGRFALMTYTFDQASGQILSGPDTLFAFEASAGPSALSSGFLALSPGGRAAYGWRDDVSIAAQVLISDGIGGAPQVISDATFNGGVVFTDEQTLLVSGNGVGAVQEGFGLYHVPLGGTPRRIVTREGGVATHLVGGDSVLYLGGGFGGAEGNQLFAFSRGEVEGAIAGDATLTLDGADRVPVDGDVYNWENAATLGDDLVLTLLDRRDPVTRVVRFPASVTGDVVGLTAAGDIATASERGVGGLAGVDGERVGLMVRAGDWVELVLVRPR